MTDQIFRIDQDSAFDTLAMEIFRYQYEQNPVYNQYCRSLGKPPEQVVHPEDIPFLPIEFFRNKRVICSTAKPDIVFESSGTTSQARSRHLVSDLSVYRESLYRGFTKFYGDPEKLCILALLPSYLERKGSSLVYMMNELIKKSRHPDSGFYLTDHQKLAAILDHRNGDKVPTLLLGVSFALLDLSESFPIPLEDHIIIMETGGMKGRRKEITRTELHRILKERFRLSRIHSEYGMTEMLSQAYSEGEGKFRTPPWLRIYIRDPYDPLSLLDTSQSGAINVMDLANIHSCSFIATDDLGVSFEDRQFNVFGRFDHAEVRGCNLLIS